MRTAFTQLTPAHLDRSDRYSWSQRELGPPQDKLMFWRI
jgi:hypothetical protein